MLWGVRTHKLTHPQTRTHSLPYNRRRTRKKKLNKFSSEKWIVISAMKMKATLIGFLIQNIWLVFPPWFFISHYRIVVAGELVFLVCSFPIHRRKHVHFASLSINWMRCQHYSFINVQSANEKRWKKKKKNNALIEKIFRTIIFLLLAMK